MDRCDGCRNGRHGSDCDGDLLSCGCRCRAMLDLDEPDAMLTPEELATPSLADWDAVA